MIHELDWHYNEDGDIYWECPICDRTVKHPKKGQPEIIVKGDQTAIHRGSIGMKITGVEID